MSRSGRQETSPRLAERRGEILDAAIEEFAKTGLHGTSTETIAERAGISQPYVFRLFGTKKELFLEAASRVCLRVREAFAAAARLNPERPLEAMGDAYLALLGRKSELLVLLHAFAASGDEEVGGPVKARYLELWEFVAKTTGASRKELRDFFAAGMGLTVAAALNLPELFTPCPEDESRDETP